MTQPPCSAEPLVPPEGAWTVDGLRALGVPQRDPLGFAYLMALARRTATQPEPVRQLLEARLASAMADCAQRCGGLPTGADTVRSRPDAPPARPAASPLAGLLRQLGSASPGPVAAGVAVVVAAPAGELKALQPFKRHWSRLSAVGLVARSAAQLPANPGPLNSQLLALRALQQMQALSPAYLQHFVARVEALLWLDSATSHAAPAPAKPARRDALRKPKAGGSRG